MTFIKTIVFQCDITFFLILYELKNKILVKVTIHWMSTTKRFSALDLFKFNDVNLDPLTETYNLQFYFHYLATWPEYFLSVESPSSRIMGYSKNNL